MAWVKIDDHFDEHPKLAQVGPLGWGVWAAGLAYCNRNLTDGFIPSSIVEGIGGRWRVRRPSEDGEEQVWQIYRGSGDDREDMESEWVADLLVDVGVWERVAGGYRVHDYLQFQPSREQIIGQREKDRTRKSGGRSKDSTRNPDGIRADSGEDSGRIPDAPVSRIPGPENHPVIPPDPPSGDPTGTAQSPSQDGGQEGAADHGPGTLVHAPEDDAQAEPTEAPDEQGQVGPDNPPVAPPGDDPYWQTFADRDTNARTFCEVMGLDTREQVDAAGVFGIIRRWEKAYTKAGVTDVLMRLDAKQHSDDPCHDAKHAVSYCVTLLQDGRPERARDSPPRRPMAEAERIAARMLGGGGRG